MISDNGTGDPGNGPIGFTVDDFTAGPWYFAVKVYDARVKKIIPARSEGKCLNTVIVNTGGHTQIESLGKGPGFEWAKRLNAFIAWNNGRDLYTLKPPSGDWRTGTWIWTRYAATGSDPGIAMNNCYSKFQWVDALGIAIIAPRAHGPVYAVRMIEGSDLPDKPPPSRPTGLRVQ